MQVYTGSFFSSDISGSNSGLFTVGNVSLTVLTLSDNIWLRPQLGLFTPIYVSGGFNPGHSLSGKQQERSFILLF